MDFFIDDNFSGSSCWREVDWSISLHGPGRRSLNLILSNGQLLTLLSVFLLWPTTMTVGWPPRQHNSTALGCSSSVYPIASLNIWDLCIRKRNTTPFAWTSHNQSIWKNYIFVYWPLTVLSPKNWVFNVHQETNPFIPIEKSMFLFYCLLIPVNFPKWFNYFWFYFKHINVHTCIHATYIHTHTSVEIRAPPNAYTYMLYQQAYIILQTCSHLHAYA